MLLLLSLSTLSLGIVFLFFSYFYQKSFSSLNKTSKVLITSLAFILLSVIMLFILFYIDITSIHLSLFKNRNTFPLIFLSTVNIIFYIIIPFLYFHFQNNTNSSEEGNFSFNQRSLIY